MALRDFFGSSQGRRQGIKPHMRRLWPYIAVALVGLGLFIWVVLGTRYYYYETASDAHFRNDGWTGTTEVLQCSDERRGDRIVHTCRWIKQ